MNYWVRFWVVVLSGLVGLSALGFLVMSFVFTDASIFNVGSTGRLAVAVVAVAALAVVVLAGVANDGGRGQSKPQSRR